MPLPDYVLQALAQDNPNQEAGSGLPDYVTQALDNGVLSIEAPKPEPRLAMADEFGGNYLQQRIPFDQIGRAVQGAANMVTKPLPIPESTGEFLTQNLPQSFARAPAALAAGIGDMAYRSAKRFTDPVYNALSGQQDLTEAAWDLAKAPRDVVHDIGDTTSKFLGSPLGFYGAEEAKKAWSDPAMALLAVAPMVKGGVKLGKALKPVPTMLELEAQLNRSTTKGFNKAIKRPGKVKSKKALLELEAEQAGAVKTIVEGKQYLEYIDKYGEVKKGKVPKTLDELSQAIMQTKARKIETANAQNRAAGELEYKVPMDSAKAELQKIVDDPMYQREAKQMVKYAEEKLADYKTLDGYTPLDAQRAMVKFNESFKLVKSNPSRKNFAKAKVDALIGNHLREGLNQVVEQATGPGYAKARKQWGELKSIEEVVATRLKRYNQQTGGTALNFYDVFAASDLLHGVLTGGKVPILKGLGLAATSMAIRAGKNPNRAVGKMFKEVDSIITEMKKVVPETEAVKIITEMEGKLQSVRQPQAQMQLEGRQNQLALPAPRDSTQLGPPMSPTIPLESGRAWERLVEIAQSPEGKQLLIQRFGREGKYNKLISSLLRLPEMKALPPGQGFTFRDTQQTPGFARQTGREIRADNQHINNLGR